jgi:hypothetical protein
MHDKPTPASHLVTRMLRFFQLLSVVQCLISHSLCCASPSIFKPSRKPDHLALLPRLPLLRTFLDKQVLPLASEHSIILIFYSRYHSEGVDYIVFCHALRPQVYFWPRLLRLLVRSAIWGPSPRFAEIPMTSVIHYCTLTTNVEFEVACGLDAMFVVNWIAAWPPFCRKMRLLSPILHV